MSADRPPSAVTQTPEARDRRAREEAAAWYARLSSERVSNAELTAFFDWRSSSLNDAAYTRLEDLARGLRSVADDPKIAALADEAARRPREGSGLGVRLGKPIMLAAVGLSLGLLALLCVWATANVGQDTYRTAFGERRAISLADGSTVELNIDSQVRVRLEKTSRRLTVDRGQVLFVVAHDRDRPFLVKAGSTVVRALGTRFEVYRHGQTVRVTLAEGRIAVTQPAATSPTQMTAGHTLAITPGGAAAPNPVDAEAATSWTSGRLTFKDARLSDAVAEVNRYSRQRVTLGPGAPADETLSGVFNAGDTHAFVAGVSDLLDLQSASQPNGDVELIASHRD